MDAQEFLPDENAVAAIRRDIAAYEAGRVSARRKVLWRVPLLLVLLVAVVWLLALLLNAIADPFEQWTSTLHVFLYVLGAILALILYWWARKPVANLQHSFRLKLLPIVFGFIGNLRYGRGVRPESFDRLPPETVGDFDRVTFDDVFAGTHGGFSFELYEAVFKNRIGTGETTLFHGVVMAFETERPFPGLLVATRKAEQVVPFFRGLFGASIDEIESGIPTIDENYEFRTDNTEAAETLVRGRLARALQWLAEAWPGEPARVALRGGDGFLLLPTPKNFFELPPISEPLDYKAHVEPIIADMASLLATAALVRKVGSGGEAGPEAQA
ncbi:DUF3137 domain-containing protein [Mesorhizobium sp. LHD-90]|uniref:DUF3137 domain-containing protein n=1 Tax=Mesorhizobium sp. LHD-90 TaxID=3071414 RepID=UPI0027DEB8FF|nr:DUF3137 domain-containing protein [Mesorhizobium sp. LHD-90]MDQ6436517.1 DUF3137 domain-containing protein [Mesorhizobium sp. LHD-90]